MQKKTSAHIMGIDVSHHQKPENVNWLQLKASGVQFVYIKATEGVTYQDPAFKMHYAGAKRAGIKVGFYHFARPYNDPKKEVGNLLATVKDFPADLPPVLDIEVNEGRKPADIAFFTKIWLQECERLTGVVPVIYSGASFAKTNLADKAFAKYPLWIAHYGVETPMGNDVWNTWSIFQYTSDGKIDGYTGRLDVNAAEPEFINPKPLPLPAIQKRIGVTINGEAVKGGYLIDGTAYVPARVVVEKLGAAIVYDGKKVEVIE